MKAFDQKFGPEFLSKLPTTPGIYRVFNAENKLIYVGKAKNLRRRLGQYRNAKRRKKHLKMRSIVIDADRIEIEHHASDREASFAEARVIQDQRPKWNVEGAFYFLYPMIGLQDDGDTFRLVYTTEPSLIPSEILRTFSFHGAFRSRFLAGGGFFSLVELLEIIGHKNKTQKLGKHTYLYSFRRIEASWFTDLELFFRGESSAALEKLILALVEHSSARRKSKEIQKHLNQLKLFWRHEAQLLLRIRKRVGTQTYPVPQKERDLLFLEHRFLPKTAGKLADK